MSLRIVHRKGDQVVKTAFAFQANYSSPFIGSEGWPTTVYYHDLLLEHLRTNFFCPSGARTVSSIFGFGQGLSRGEETLVSFPSENFVYNDDRHDDRYYGNITRNFQIFGSALGFGDFTRHPSFLGENQCRHMAYSGELITKQEGIPMWNESYQFYDLSTVVGNTHGNVWQFCTVNTVSPDLDVSAYSANYGGLVSHNLLDLLNYLIGKTASRTAVIGGHLSYTNLSQIEYHINDAGIVVKYHCYARNHVISAQYNWDVELTVLFKEPEIYTNPIVGVSYATQYTGSVKYRYYNAYTDDIDNYMGRTVDEYVGSGPYQSFPVMLTLPGTDYLGAGTFPEAVVAKCERRLFLASFAKAADMSYRDITASSAYSTVEALKQVQNTLDVNLVQDINELPEICESIPDFERAIKALSKVVRRDLSFATLKEIVDVATSENLRYAFGSGPTLDTFLKTLPKIVSTFSKLGVVSKHAVGYGSFTRQLTNKLGREELLLQTRTKIVLDTSFSELVSATLRIDALGILPKVSNVWDTLPFTFVVNWFTGIGSAIKRAEYLAFAATIPAYYVHTYTLTSPLSQRELDILTSSSSSAKPASLKLFYRDISLYSPIPRESSLGFDMPPGIPNWGTAGSLLYQLLFGR